MQNNFQNHLTCSIFFVPNKACHCTEVRTFYNLLIDYKIFSYAMDVNDMNKKLLFSFFPLMKKKSTGRKREMMTVMWFKSGGVRT